MPTQNVGFGGGRASSFDYENGLATGTIDPITGMVITDANGTKKKLTPEEEARATQQASGMRRAAGWAGTQNFNPSELASIYDEPWRLIARTFDGIPVGGAGYSALRNMPADPLELRMMTEGAQGILAGAEQGATDEQKGYGSAQYANYLNNLYQQMGSAGGQGFNASDLLGNIFAQGTDQGPGQAQTSLAQLLSSGDTTTQMRSMYNLVRAATKMGMDPLAAQAYQSAFLAAMDSYGSQALSNDAGSQPALADYLRENFSQLTSF